MKGSNQDLNNILRCPCGSCQEKYAGALYELYLRGELNQLTDKQYWERVIEVWRRDCEPSTALSCWKVLFAARKPDPSFTEDLPERVTIYRGGHPYGLSWTLAYFVAERFSSRSECKGFWKTQIKKTDIIFFTNEWDEEEIVLGSLQNIKPSRCGWLDAA